MRIHQKTHREGSTVWCKNRFVLARKQGFKNLIRTKRNLTNQCLIDGPLGKLFAIISTEIRGEFFSNQQQP